MRRWKVVKPSEAVVGLLVGYPRRFGVIGRGIEANDFLARFKVKIRHFKTGKLLQFRNVRVIRHLTTSFGIDKRKSWRRQLTAFSIRNPLTLYNMY